MKSEFEELPFWTWKSLQGVAYWMGHRRCLYKDHPLSEGALVAEICNLIYANLSKQQVLSCEVQYSELLEGEMPEEFGRQIRADLVVTDRGEELDQAKFVIEVKRASAPPALVNRDLRRLVALRRQRPHVRAFLFVVSEANRPRRFVDAAGKSIRKRRRIPGDPGHYRVRHTWKAAHAYTMRETAQYACVIEVYPY